MPGLGVMPKPSLMREKWKFYQLWLLQNRKVEQLMRSSDPKSTEDDCDGAFQRW